MGPNAITNAGAVVSLVAMAWAASFDVAEAAFIARIVLVGTLARIVGSTRLCCRCVSCREHVVCDRMGMSA